MMMMMYSLQSNLSLLSSADKSHTTDVLTVITWMVLTAV